MNVDDITEPLLSLTADFNGFDWVSVAVVSVSLVMGIYRGFGREVLSLLGWVAAFVGANLLAKVLSGSMSGLIDNSTLRYLLSWGLVFVGVLAAFGVLGNLLANQLKQPGFNLGNRLLGGVFGILRGLVVMMVATLLLKAMVPVSERDWLSDSELMPVIDKLGSTLADVFGELQDIKPVEGVEDSLESADMI